MSKVMLNLLLVSLLVSGFVGTALAQTHKGISFQGVIKLPTGDYPTRSGMTVNARILSPNGCVLREEEFSGVNISNGYINLSIGTGVVGGYDPSLTLANVMDNSAVKSSLVCLNSDGTVSGSVTSFNPATTNGARKFRVSLTIDSYPIVADFNIRSVAYAINSETLNGKSDTDFVAVNNAKNLNQANMESIFQRFTKLDALLNNSDGTGTNLGINITGSANNVSGVVAVANGGTGASDAATARANLGLGPLAIITPTGTADATTYLRGDGTWATVSSVGSETDPTVQSFAKNVPSTGLSVTSNQLTVSYGTTAGTAAQGNDSRITGAFQSSTTLSGDLSGTLPSPVVEKIKGQSISAAGTAIGQVLRYAGANTWTPGFVSMSDLRSSVTGSAALSGTGCAAGETLSWSSVSDSLACISISITKSQISDFPTLAASATTDTTDATNITAGTLSVARLPTSVTDGLWTSSSPDIYRTSGNVGIGTSTPQKTLHVAGTFRQDIDNTLAGHSIYAYSNTYYRGPVITQYRSHGTLAAPTAVLINDYLGGFSGVGYDGTAYGGTGVMAVAQSAEDWTTSAHGANLSIYTIPTGSTTNGLSMIIKGGANPLVGIGTATPASALHVGTAPTASANAPLLALGSAPFNGTSGGYFVGNSNGTVIGANTAAGYTGDFLNFEIAGVSKFKIDSSGTITSGGNIVSSGNTTSTGNYSTTGNISTTGTGSITSAGPLVSNSSTASTSPSTGALIVSGGAGIGGALNVGGSAYLGNSSANYVTINGAASGSSPTITASGSDANINLTLTPKGSGNTIISSGYMGIGTTAPFGALHIDNNNGADAADDIWLTTYSNSATPSFISVKARGNESSPSATLSGDTLFTLSMNGHTGSALKNAAVMKAIATGDFSVSPTADLTFWTNGGGAAATERMRITAGGNVGIGTTAPGRQLVIDGGVADVSTGKATLEIVTSSTTYGPRLRLNSTGAWGREFLLISTQAADTAGAGKFSIYDSTASVNRMIIDSTGNVGIGTTAPKTLFETQVPNASGAATVAGTFSMTSFTGSTNNEVKVLLGPTNLPADSAGISASRRVPGSTGFSIYTGNAGTSLEAVHIKGNGNVGIGTATPSQKLEIPGTWASTLFSGDNVVIRKPNYVGAWARNLMQFEEYDGTVLNALGVYGTNNSFTYGYIGTSWSSPSIVWKPSGNVGIGTTTPAASLVVNKTAPTGTIASTGTAVSGTGTNFTTAFSVGDQIIANGQAKTITVITDAANMTVNTAFSSDLTAGTTYTRVGTILSAGNVGIGTSQPLYSLHVNGDANLGGVIFKGQTDYDSSASVYPIISRSAAGGSGVFPFNTSGNLVLAPRADGSNIVFATGATTPQTRMVISGSGNVGIGTSSPAAALDVNGTASIGVSGKVNISAAGVISSSVNGNYIPINISNPTGYAHILVNNSVDFGSGGTDGYIKLHDNSKGIFLDSSGIRFNYASGTEAARINSSGNLGIGITNPGYKLDVNGDTNIASGSALRFGGTQVCTSAGCTSSSDRNLKESIQPLQNSLEKVLKLQGVEYDYKDKVKFTDKHQVGVIAQDVEKVYPEVVLKDPKTGLRSVAYDHLVGPLIEAFKSLYQRVVGIESRQAMQDRDIASVKAAKADQKDLESAKAQIKKLEAENTALKAYLCSKDPTAVICK